MDGGSVHATGTDASGIQIGRLREDGSLEFASPVGEDGYRRQSVSVNAPVTGGPGEDAAGVFLAGGGRVTIGPEGSVGAASGIAILASGGDAPKLLVEMDLDGRRAAEVVHEGWIINDGGETTLVVNGVTLHEGAGGITGAAAANGAWDLSLSASGMIQGRAFTPEDFIETHAPRAAVYEALPGFLLRQDAGRPTGGRVMQPGSPVWARISGGRGSYEPDRASVGAAYDFRRFSVEAGLDVALDESLTGLLSLHHIGGTADVDSPYGGGEIEAEGVGVATGLSWNGADGHYARGRVAFTSYEVDVSSRARGRRGARRRGERIPSGHRGGPAHRRGRSGDARPPGVGGATLAVGGRVHRRGGLARIARRDDAAHGRRRTLGTDRADVRGRCADPARLGGCRARPERRGHGRRCVRRAPRVGSFRYPHPARTGRGLAQGAVVAGRAACRGRPGVRRYGILGPDQARLDVLGPSLPTGLAMSPGPCIAVDVEGQAEQSAGQAAEILHRRVFRFVWSAIGSRCVWSVRWLTGRQGLKGCFSPQPIGT